MLLLVAMVALAQDVVYPAEFEVDFHDDLSIEGQMIGPGIDVVREPPPPRFNPLIRLRQSFEDEIRASVREVG